METGTQPRMQCEDAVLVGPARLQGARQVVVALADGGAAVPQQGGNEVDMVRIVQGHAGRRRMPKMVHRHPPGEALGRELLDPVGELDQRRAADVDPQVANLGGGGEARPVDLEIAPQPRADLRRQGKAQVGGILEIARLEVQREILAVGDQVPVQAQVGEGAPAQRACGQKADGETVAIGQGRQDGPARRNPASASRMAARPAW